MRIPDKIDGANVVRFVIIDNRHRPTGNTKHTVEGEVMGPAFALAICQYDNDDGFYLFYCDQNWKVLTDTWHESLEKAVEQAEFEYEGSSQSWVE